LALLVSGTVSWLLNEHHVGTSWELALLFMSVSQVLLIACTTWILYIALEPSVRRRWPGILVASTRLMSGAWRDSVVGREVLIGSVTGAGAACIERLGLVLPTWLGRPEEFPIERSVGYTFASSFSASSTFDGIGWSIGDVLILLFFFLLARTLLRNDWIAAAAVLLLFFLPPFLSADNPWIRGSASLLTGAFALAVLMRVGLVAGVVHFIVSTVFLMYPITFEFSAWYSKVGLIALAWAAAFAIFGFFVSIQGQKLLDIEGMEKPS
jgi:serine/threonine-protein kinase